MKFSTKIKLLIAAATFVSYWLLLSARGLAWTGGPGPGEDGP